MRLQELCEQSGAIGDGEADAVKNSILSVLQVSSVDTVMPGTFHCETCTFPGRTPGQRPLRSPRPAFRATYLRRSQRTLPANRPAAELLQNGVDASHSQFRRLNSRRAFASSKGGRSEERVDIDVHTA